MRRALAGSVVAFIALSAGSALGAGPRRHATLRGESLTIFVGSSQSSASWLFEPTVPCRGQGAPAERTFHIRNGEFDHDLSLIVPKLRIRPDGTFSVQIKIGQFDLAGSTFERTGSITGRFPTPTRAAGRYNFRY